jgi:deazaflavin-dependent oxidoreductase (nitroreductase family)
MSHLSPLEQVGLRLLRIHDLLYQKSGGRIGHHIPGMPPNLLLHTTGARTGIARVNTLTYASDAGKYYIVASMGGAPKSPGWYHNLKAHPNVEINLGTRRLPVTARPILPDDPDYARLWKLVNDNNAGRYDGYQKKTSRPIPIVELTP